MDVFYVCIFVFAYIFFIVIFVVSVVSFIAFIFSCLEGKYTEDDRVLFMLQCKINRKFIKFFKF